jgi:hypothetical protein
MKLQMEEKISLTNEIASNNLNWVIRNAWLLEAGLGDADVLDVEVSFC